MKYRARLAIPFEEIKAMLNLPKDVHVIGNVTIQERQRCVVFELASNEKYSFLTESADYKVIPDIPTDALKSGKEAWR